MAVETDIQCRCCVAVYQPARSIDSWITCPGCGVFTNMQWHDTPIQLAEQIRQVPKEIISDITKFVQILDSMNAGGPLYDVCAYIGTLPYLCRLRGFYGVGNEISPGAIAVAKNLFDVVLQYGEFEDLDCAVGVYGEVVFHHGIEHVREPARAIAKAIDMLRPGGHIYLAHPVMRDRTWLSTFGHYAHRHEWTFEAFARLIARFGPQVEIVDAGYGEFDTQDSAQHWLLRKI